MTILLFYLSTREDWADKIPVYSAIYQILLDRSRGFVSFLKALVRREEPKNQLPQPEFEFVSPFPFSMPLSDPKTAVISNHFDCLTLILNRIQVTNYFQALLSAFLFFFTYEEILSLIMGQRQKQA